MFIQHASVRSIECLNAKDRKSQSGRWSRRSSSRSARNRGIHPKIDILRLDIGPSTGVAMLMPRPQGNCSA